MDSEERPAMVGRLAGRVAAGEPRAIARALSIIEDEEPTAAALVAALFPAGGRAGLVGITGPPGAGKSTLVGQLVSHWRSQRLKVAVLAVDPSSPFTGGAILGDRVRMQRHAEDPGVFIRSMATRGHLGGLAAATADAAVLLDAAGFDVVIVETVGVGQDEVEVALAADTVVVVTVPGTGDDVQAMKAGIMEIADVFVVNKADREGADRAVAEIEDLLALDERAPARARPPVLRVTATTGDGVGALAAVIDEHARGRTARTGLDRADRRLREVIARRAVARATRTAGSRWQAVVHAMASRAIDPYTAADSLLGDSASVAIDHVGIGTDDAAATLGFFCELLGLPAGAPEDVPSQGVRVRFLGAGGARVEVVEAAGNASPFARALASRGPGIHHVAFRVDDLPAVLARLTAAGVRLIDTVGRPGAHGTTVAFVHPSSTRGVLVELVERHEGDARVVW